MTGVCGLQSAVCAGLSAEEQATIDIFNKTSPSVVFIKNAALQWDWLAADMYEVPQGAGSGFIWDNDGHVITNFHVIYQADRLEVTLSDQKSYPAKIVGLSPDFDIAVLKIDAPKDKLRAIPIGSSKSLKVGQKVLSIGNPFGLDSSLTTGVVSAIGRSIRSIGGRMLHDVIQTDAAINPGNSGGPILNSSGEVIGISTAIYSPSGAYAGVSFAIPVDVVKRIVPQLIQFGKVKRVGLGLSLVPDIVRARLGVKGAMILEADPTSSAAKAGLKSTKRDYYGQVIYGDIIVSLDKKPVENNDDLIEVIDSIQSVGAKVDIEFLRNGKKFGTTAVLQEL